MIPVSIQQPLQHYQWGDGCDGWVLADEPTLSIKQERMPAGTSEALHYHQYAQQFFFILKGVATFEIEGEIVQVLAQQGLYIAAGKKHKISNNETTDLSFILSSQPSTANDRHIIS